MFESLAWPAALVGALALPVLVVLHRRARPHGERPYPAFFLLPAEVREGLAGRRWRSPWLLLLRLAAATLLVMLAVGPGFRSAGTLVLTTGPLEVERDWAAPVVYVRAGTPPTLASEPGSVLPVAGRPDWSAALFAGRRVAPDAVVVRREWRPAARILGAGAGPDEGDAVRVVAALDGPGEVTLTDAAGRHHRLERRRNGASLRAALPPGGAWLSVPGAEPFPVCVPVVGPVTVADAGWPEGSGLDDVFGALESLGGVRRVPWQSATWQPGATAAPLPVGGGPRASFAPFAPDVTRVFFPDGALSGTATALVPEDDLPAPGAMVRAFEPLDPPGEALWRAGDAVVADRLAGPDGRALRFGFQPRDSELPESPAWPVFIARQLERERALRARCLEHEAGRPLDVLTADGFTVIAPDGARRSVTPVAGVAHLDGLDAQGLYGLEQGPVRATVAVRPPVSVPRAAAVADPPAVTAERGPRSPPPLPFPLVVLALSGVLATVFAARRWREAIAWVAVGLTALAALDPRPTLTGTGVTVVAIDTSASVDRTVARGALREVLGALGDAEPVRRVEGDDAVRAVDPAEPLSGRGGATLAGPLLRAAAALAGPDGAIIYLGDGLAPDLPVPAQTPVFPLAVGARATDVAVVDARAVRMGDLAYIQARFAADAPTTAEIEIDRVTTELALPAGGTRILTARVRPSATTDEVLVRAQVAGDPRSENDTLRVPVPADPLRRVAVVALAADARAPMAWSAAAGLEPSPFDPDALGTEDARLWSAGAIWVHDVPAERLPTGAGAGLAAFVRHGGVLVLSGRSRAFGAGGWGGTPLETLSPVTVDPRPPGAGRLAVALLLDRSGSMADAAGGIGTEAVGRLARGLASGLRPEDDRLAVLAFGTQAHVLLPPTRAGALRDRVLPVPDQARGGTRLRPALVAGLETLVATEAETRVLVVVSDGKFADAGEALPVDALRAASVRVLAVLVGAEADPSVLEDLARATGGDWVAGRPDEVLRLGAAGVAGLAGGGLLAGPTPVTPGAAWSVRVGGPSPAVPGRVRIRERAEARVLARADGDPLLAEWQVGAGRVIALATDDWSLSAAAWGTLLAPVGAERRGGARLSVEGSRIVLQAAAAPVDLEPVAHLTAPEGELAAVRLVPTAPGRWAGPLPEGPRGGPWRAAVELPDERVELRFAPPLPDELRPAPPDLEQLAAQAAATGGRMLTEPADAAVALDRRTRRGGTPLAPWLLLLALVALVLDAAAWAGLRPGASRAARG